MMFNVDSVVNFERKCRICASDLLDISCAIKIFSGIGLEEKMERYLYIKVTKNDELPKSICATCFIKIESIDKFAYMAAKTEETYIAYLMRSKDKFPSPVQTFMHQDENSVDNMQQVPSHSPGQQKVILKTYRNPRNPRHVDHITLEQIINDQIVKNPKLGPISPTIVMTSPVPSNNIGTENSIIAYHDLKIGQLIKDEELLKLILKALKWTDMPGNKRNVSEYWLKKLKQSKFREILSNPNLLNDSDLMQLIKSYVGQDALTLFNSLNVPIPVSYTNIMPKQFQFVSSPAYHQSPTNSLNLQNDQDSVTQMEVGVDPSLFIDDETRNSTPTVMSDRKNEENQFICSMCPKVFNFNEELQNHLITTHFQGQSQKKQGRKQIRTKKQNSILTDHDTTDIKSELNVCPHTNENVERRGRKPKRDNHDMSLQCPYCRKLLSTKGNLKVHINVHKRKGDATNSVSCSKCQKISVEVKEETSKQESNEMNVVETPEVDEKSVAMKEVAQTQSNKLKKNRNESTRQKFSCESCNRVFGSKGALSIHLLSHALAKTKKKKQKGNVKRMKSLKTQDAETTTNRRKNPTDNLE
uniref:CSON008816 protein n=1 Tax=Culicoides sonorensis TaxID=179676 RepID=A0A336LZA8_CULSO